VVVPYPIGTAHCIVGATEIDSSRAGYKRPETSTGRRRAPALTQRPANCPTCPAGSTTTCPTCPAAQEGLCQVRFPTRLEQMAATDGRHAARAPATVGTPHKPKDQPESFLSR
jgi:hypothetical protein